MRACLNRVTLPPATTGPQLLRAAHTAGFELVEISARRLIAALREDAAVRELLDQGRMIPIHGGWSIRLAWGHDAFAAALPVVATEMKMVAALGSRSGALVLPPVIEDYSTLIERIRVVADLAAAHGLDLVCEFLGARPNAAPAGGTNGAAGRCRTLGEALQVIEAVDRANTGVLVDAFHWHASGGTTADLAQIPAAMPVMVHLNDAPPQPRQMLDDSMRRLPGRGVIDLPGFLRALHRRGYRGAVSVEVKDPALHAIDPYQSAAHAYAAVAAVLEESLGSLDQPPCQRSRA